MLAQTNNQILGLERAFSSICCSFFLLDCFLSDLKHFHTMCKLLNGKRTAPRGRRRMSRLYDVQHWSDMSSKGIINSYHFDINIWWNAFSISEQSCSTRFYLYVSHTKRSLLHFFQYDLTHFECNEDYIRIVRCKLHTCIQSNQTNCVPISYTILMGCWAKSHPSKVNFHLNAIIHHLDHSVITVIIYKCILWCKQTNEWPGRWQT